MESLSCSDAQMTVLRAAVRLLRATGEERSGARRRGAAGARARGGASVRNAAAISHRAARRGCNVRSGHACASTAAHSPVSCCRRWRANMAARDGMRHGRARRARARSGRGAVDRRHELAGGRRRSGAARMPCAAGNSGASEATCERAGLEQRRRAAEVLVDRRQRTRRPPRRICAQEVLSAPWVLCSAGRPPRRCAALSSVCCCSRVSLL